MFWELDVSETKEDRLTPQPEREDQNLEEGLPAGAGGDGGMCCSQGKTKSKVLLGSFECASLSDAQITPSTQKSRIRMRPFI